MFLSESNTFSFNKSEYVGYARRKLFIRVTYILLFLTVTQSSKLVFLPASLRDSLYLYISVTLVHLAAFLLCLLVFHRDRLNLGNWLLHISFISFMTSSVFLWQVDLSLQYFYLLAVLVSAFMFGEKQGVLFLFFSIFYSLMFLGFQYFKSMDLVSTQNYSVINMINSVLMAMGSMACAWTIRKITLRGFQQSQNFTESQQSMIYRVFPERIPGGVISLKNRHDKQTKDLMYKSLMTVVCIDVVNASTEVSSIKDDAHLQLVQQSFDSFDARIRKAGCLRIKTDSPQYVFVLELKGKKEEARVCQCLNLIRDLHALFAKNIADTSLALRCGVATGELSAGMVNLNNPGFDVWGQALVVASRLEKSCQPMHLHCDKRTHELAQTRFFFSEPAVWKFRGVGEILTHQMRLS